MPPPPPVYPLHTDQFKPSDKVAVKIRGLPFKAEIYDIQEFFKGHNYVKNSIIFGLSKENRKNGFAAILFSSNEEAKNAIEDKSDQKL